MLVARSYVCRSLVHLFVAARGPIPALWESLHCGAHIISVICYYFSKTISEACTATGRHLTASSAAQEGSIQRTH